MTDPAQHEPIPPAIASERIPRYLTTLPTLVCLTVLLLACFSQVLFAGRQFGFRDTAEYYYPLYQRVEMEWDAGRWPLWEPEENGGVPLLGNPTAAVLYPGKLIFRVLPYAWGLRVYVIAHTVLAFAGMIVLLRSWNVSHTGATLAALGYAFGGPTLFQYSNVIFLVGAAWIPFGIRAADRWLRLGRRSGIVELAVVLALQTLGGDPQAAYLTGLCAAGYALGLAATQRTRPDGAGRRIPRSLLAFAIVSAWIIATLAAARWFPALRTPTHGPPLPLPWMVVIRWAVPMLWMGLGLGLLIRRRGRPLFLKLAGLALAASLAFAVSAAQLLPVLEFISQTVRSAGDGPADFYAFSVEPVRTVELLWPGPFGTFLRGNRSFLPLLPTDVRGTDVWTPSLYVGGLTILLALSAVGLRRAGPVRGWLTGILLVSMLASFGEYMSPLWWTRSSPALQSSVGPRDPGELRVIRSDGQLRDGDGSVYWMLMTFLPGFRSFRLPAKLFTFTTLALSALAGLGWDRLLAGQARRIKHLAAALLALSLIGLAAAGFFRDELIKAIESRPESRRANVHGPMEVRGAVADVQRSLLHGAVVFAAALFLAKRPARRSALSCVVVLFVATADLAFANARDVVTVPQRLFDAPSRVLEMIRAAERENPSDGPYRIHRKLLWSPVDWVRRASYERSAETVAWERDTLFPKYGIPLGVNYTWTFGVSELEEYHQILSSFWRPAGAGSARKLGATPGQEIALSPRRAFDFWNTRYFILPAYPGSWTEEHRGFAAFLADTDTLYPAPGAFTGPLGQKRQRDWIENEDFQLLRNRVAYPRAWVVHAARFHKPIVGIDFRRHDGPLPGPMEEMLFQNDELWNDPSIPVFDPKTLAWVDERHSADLREFLPGMAPSPSESVHVSRYEPQRVELEVTLEHPGLVILSDVFYPGWRLRMDDRDAPIYRTNRAMRGAAVPAGKHHLVYSYEPASFALGARISVAACAALVLLALWFARQPAVADVVRESSSGGRPIKTA